MSVLGDVRVLLLRYPITFLALGAAAAAIAPVMAVSTAPALRPWARRVLSGALAVRGEARRIAAESQEAYENLLAEALREGGAGVAAGAAAGEERRPAPRAPASPRAEASHVERAVPQA